MNNPVLQSLADRMPSVDQKIADLEELISAEQEADKDVTAQRAELEMLKIERNKWVNMLKSRGYLK